MPTFNFAVSPTLKTQATLYQARVRELAGNASPDVSMATMLPTLLTWAFANCPPAAYLKGLPVNPGEAPPPPPVPPVEYLPNGLVKLPKGVRRSIGRPLRKELQEK